MDSNEANWIQTMSNRSKYSKIVPDKAKKANGVKQGQTTPKGVKQILHALKGKQRIKQTVMIFFSRRIYTPVLVSFYDLFFQENRQLCATQLNVAEKVH